MSESTDWMSVKQFCLTHPGRNGLPVTRQYASQLIARELARPGTTKILVRIIEGRHQVQMSQAWIKAKQDKAAARLNRPTRKRGRPRLPHNRQDE